ncbi:MAG: SUMF1/EgtB/PvdO family nonheme iron enzyme [Pirellulales bacterium]|nr:SUMF1/EgtB/PvdO family nonheme iron enzyme [Pirellulales bacterium]
MRIPAAFLSGLAILAVVGAPASGDDFGGGEHAFTIEFVTIGAPGNPPDALPNTAGAVPYVYRIAAYEISERMIDAANALGGLGITKDERGPDKPATSVTWFEAAAFANWLNTSTGHPPAYKFDGAGAFQLWLPTDPGYDATNLYRNKRAKYFLPSTDEWHKAAYYDPVAGRYWDYPTGSDNVPDGIDFPGDTIFDAVFFDGGNQLGPNDVINVGVASPSGAFGLGGNVFEWVETAVDRVNSTTLKQRGQAGGDWGSTESTLRAARVLNGSNPGLGLFFNGFRVVSAVPEPNSLGPFVILIGGIRAAFYWMEQGSRRSRVRQ